MDDFHHDPLHPNQVFSVCWKCKPADHHYFGGWVDDSTFTVEYFEGVKFYTCHNCGHEFTELEYSDYIKERAAATRPVIDPNFQSYDWNGGYTPNCIYCSHNQCVFVSGYLAWVCLKCGHTFTTDELIQYEHLNSPPRHPILTEAWSEANCPKCWRRGLVPPDQVLWEQQPDGEWFAMCECGEFYTSRDLKR
jgi:hypothetical protein